MANLLSKHHTEVTYEPENLGDNSLELIINAYRKNLKIKTVYENKLWKFDSSQASNEFVDADELIEQKKHHKIFTKKNGVKGILHFLNS